MIKDKNTYVKNKKVLIVVERFVSVMNLKNE